MNQTCKHNIKKYIYIFEPEDGSTKVLSRVEVAADNAKEMNDELEKMLGPAFSEVFEGILVKILINK